MTGTPIAAPNTGSDRIGRPAYGKRIGVPGVGAQNYYRPFL